MTKNDSAVSERPKNAVAVAAFGMIISALFFLDITTSVEIGAGIGYSGAMVICLWMKARAAPLLCAALLSILVAVGGYAPDGVLEGLSEASLINRGLAVASIWAVAFLLTRRKAFEANISQTAREALSDSAARSHFMANMSHELRTPLNAILGFSEALSTNRLGPPDSIRYQEYIGYIHRSADHLLRIVNDLLDISRIDIGQYDAFLEGLDAMDHIKTAVSTMALMAKGKGVRLTADLPVSLPWVSADHRLLQQTLLNLLSNAIKFTPSGGHVTVRANVAADAVAVEIVDTGIGIRPDQIAEVTKPFRQANSSTRRSATGAGLGLALAKSFTQLQNGQLSITSEVGVGTTVRVEMPIARLETPVAGDAKTA